MTGIELWYWRCSYYSLIREHKLKSPFTIRIWTLLFRNSKEHSTTWTLAALINGHLLIFSDANSALNPVEQKIRPRSVRLRSWRPRSVVGWRLRGLRAGRRVLRPHFESRPVQAAAHHLDRKEGEEEENCHSEKVVEYFLIFMRFLFVLGPKYKSPSKDINVLEKWWVT